MFFSQRQIEKALKALESVHPFFGTSYLVLKQAGLPVEEATRVHDIREEEQFLRKYYQPDSRSAWFYRPFRVSNGSRRYWEISWDYVWEGYPSMGTPSQLPPAFAIAVWLYRERDWPKETTPQDVIDYFFHQFKITSDVRANLFDVSVPEISGTEGWLVEKPFSWTELCKSLYIPLPPDAPIEEGGILSHLKIEGVGPARRLDLDLAKRVNLFAGDNGLGKSFLLECAWWALSGQWAGSPVYPRKDAQRDEPKIRFQIQGVSGRHSASTCSYNWESQEWSFPDKRPTIPGLLIYARVDGAFAIWDPAQDRRASTDKMAGAKPLVFTRGEVWNGLQDRVNGKTVFLSNGLIADWILWQNSPEKQPFETLKQVLRRLSPPDLEYGDLGRLEPGEPTRISGDSRWMPTIKHSYGEIPLVHASAGVRRIVALAYLIVWAWEEHKAQSELIRKEPQTRMVVLIDEIEAHLHPKWQRRILPALLGVPGDLAPELGAQFLIATHSPLVMASIEPGFDTKRDKIFRLDLVKHDLFGAEVELHEPEFVLYGTVDSWLRSNIFELPQARSEEAERAIEDARKLQMRGDVTEKDVAEVSQRLLKYLAAHDRFWHRWTFFAAEHGVDL
jgi:hypothetical protein